MLAALDDLDLESGDTRDHEITHTLPFKCIGAAHEKEYQESLEQAHHVLHEQKKDVAVRLRPEPNNINDGNAIAIDMDYGSDWKVVGYIAKELCYYLHPLLAADDIVNVYVEHIVFRVDFLKYGFYPKIMITRRGQWDQNVVRKSKSVR